MLQMDYLQGVVARISLLAAFVAGRTVVAFGLWLTGLATRWTYGREDHVPLFQRHKAWRNSLFVHWEVDCHTPPTFVQAHPPFPANHMPSRRSTLRPYVAAYHLGCCRTCWTARPT